MKKLENNVLQRFMFELIEVLKEYNETTNTHTAKSLNIPFIISTLYQNFSEKADKYDEFIQDLWLYPDYNFLILDSQNDYSGIIDVEINLVKYQNEENEQYYMNGHSPNYDYKLYFTYDTRDYGYCQCTPDMPDYREDKQCCGHGCDAAFCKFSLHKVLHIASGSWEGDEHDYWEFEDEFYLGDKELAKKKENEDREREIEELKNRIEADQKRLKDLEGE